jgi:ABC-type bacteriocin/lantibiotic exporter with double-glycine peptidase domain
LAGDSPMPMKRTDGHVNEYLDARESHFKILVRHYSLLVVFKVLVAAGLLVIGGILVMNQHMNIGQFIAAEIIILLVISSVEKLIVSIETIYDVLTSLEKIGQVTDLEMEKVDGMAMSIEANWTGMSVELTNLSFSYPDHGIFTLSGVDLTIPKGERIQITGQNGSGKSTLLQILAGLYSPQNGNLAYDGLGIGSLNINDLQSAIGDCLSQEQLFQGTLYENITMGREDANMDNVKWAFENLGLSEFLKKSDKGFETLIDPQGRKLPRSIIQKLILARSIADKPRLLLLEDAFEHLDINERHEIIDFLLKPEHPWTVVAVSSDEYLEQVVDRKIIMKDGKIIDQIITKARNK